MHLLKRVVYGTVTIGLLFGLAQPALSDVDVKSAAKQGNVIAQANLGAMYREGRGVEQDYSKALEWSLKAAIQGDAIAQYHLGLMYEAGEGVEQDYFKAIEWYEKAAYQDFAQAQNNLGGMYFKGHGVRQSLSKAVEWTGKACDNADQLGCDNYRIVKKLLAK
ncbi:tetratricopeptide repeat protein [Psychrobacter celer]|jgi:hypothetical protein|uniref:tetratricopeptide repeat protein n=2 Tax=Psychrobacter celer TaxID=306572 RepID=UPI003FB674B5